MEKDGLLRSKLQPSSKGPKRRVYSLTAAGRKMLREWLLGEPKLGDERYGFVAQFFFMDATGDWGETKRYTTELRDVLIVSLKKYQEIERAWARGETGFPAPESPSGFHQHMALRGGLHHVKARIKWCDEIIERVNSRIEASTSSNGRTTPHRKQKVRRKQ